MTDGFRHEALFYRDEDEFLAGTLAFVGDGVAAGEPVMVALGGGSLALLRSELGSRAERVQFVEMGPLGRNPGRIISAWREFVADAGERPTRGIGEPAWPGRSAEELEECDHHESLLNLAFVGAAEFTLLCPYDAGRLSPEVLAAARRNHPWVCEDGEFERCENYVESFSSTLAGDLTAPPGEVGEFPFVKAELGALRRYVEEAADAAGIAGRRRKEVVLAASELAANSVVHGGGTGRLRAWREPGAFVCEVADRGRIEDPLVGRRRPDPEEPSGRGLWIANQLCDLVQVRSGDRGTVVRLRIDLN